ncbi:hypothetical protein GCM10027321_17890 [Massilia terrae]|uniref:YdcF family protein n=1 Tax=Massilia terrae TaxID=1811224 RepID=A0ABT2CVZ4_9BURK|nr:YdcF family protein [Massilia terrae]MCS0658141.1 YdcF family protein [Massilia terrae]
MTSKVPLPSAVIVLANLMDENGVLNKESAARAAKAVELFRATGSDFIVTCGWPYRSDSSLPIALAFRDHLLKNYDTPSSAIITETNSRDTVGDAWFTKVNVAVPRGFRSLHVVTSEYHVTRTAEIFNTIYGPGFQITVHGANVTDDAAIRENEARSLQAFRDTFKGVTPGDDQAILDRLREQHPFYNGAIYPRI